MSKALVAYFSAQGTTAKVAVCLADAIGADLSAIEPEVAYTKPDLDWTNKKSRSTVEMEDRSSRPAIKDVGLDISQYDVIFVGFPVWWYREPSIIDTFMEAYDFSGKTVIPFATSGMSPIGDSGKNMQKLAPGAKVAAGKRFPNHASAAELEKWASEWL